MGTQSEMGGTVRNEGNSQRQRSTVRNGEESPEFGEYGQKWGGD